MISRFATRLAYELVLPRVLPLPLVWVGRAIAVLVVIWGFAVCITITAAVITAILGI